MRPGYTLSGKKIPPEKKPTTFAQEILYALNRKQVKSKGRTKIFEGIDNDNVVDLRHKKTQAAKKARKNRGNR